MSLRKMEFPPSLQRCATRATETWLRACRAPQRPLALEGLPGLIGERAAAACLSAVTGFHVPPLSVIHARWGEFD